MRDLAQRASNYNRDGYVSGVDILSIDDAQEHRRRLEEAERAMGSLHYKAKMHTVFTSTLELVTHPKILDLVEALIGPDILLYDSQYIIKEPDTPSFVSWHQDLTYWGLSDDAQVSLWLALSPATAQSGCMRMIAGSHTQGVFNHETSNDVDNVLLQSQTVSGIDDAAAVMCPLEPGQASFHHGWTLHASMPNTSPDRRIGVNAQFIASHVRQTKHDKDTTMLVRGEDRYGHFSYDRPARADFEPLALTRWRELSAQQVATQGS